MLFPVHTFWHMASRKIEEMYGRREDFHIRSHQLFCPKNFPFPVIDVSAAKGQVVPLADVPCSTPPPPKRHWMALAQQRTTSTRRGGRRDNTSGGVQYAPHKRAVSARELPLRVSSQRVACVHTARHRRGGGCGRPTRSARFFWRGVYRHDERFGRRGVLPPKKQTKRAVIQSVFLAR